MLDFYQESPESYVPLWHTPGTAAPPGGVVRGWRRRAPAPAVSHPAPSACGRPAARKTPFRVGAVETIIQIINLMYGRQEAVP